MYVKVYVYNKCMMMYIVCIQHLLLPFIPINRYPRRIQDSITPESLSYILGFFGTIIYCIWQIIYTLPRFDELIINEIVTHNGNIIIIISAFILLIFINFIHAYCFFHLLGSVGATTTGVYIVCI